MTNNTDGWKIKFRSMIRKQNINMLAWQENNPNPQTEEELNGLLSILGKLKDNVQSYCENIRQYGWEKHSTTIPLNESKLLEQKEWLEKQHGVVNDEFIEGSGS